MGEPHKNRQVDLSSFVSHCIDGALSGLVGGVVLQPLQVIKTAMQIKPLGSSKSKGVSPSAATAKATDSGTTVFGMKSKRQHLDMLTFRQATVEIYSREGLGGYYRGLLPAILRTAGNSALYFPSLHICKNMYASIFDKEYMANSMASTTARLLQSLISNPLNVVKQRFEVIGFNEYSGLADSFLKLYQKEGARGFFTGLGVSLIRDLPLSGIYYPTYVESMRVYALLLGFERISETQQNNKMQLMLLSTSAALTANVIACAVTHPVDIIRTRIVFKTFTTEAQQSYDGIADAIVKIYRYDGLIGFFRGLTPRIMRKGLGSVLIWTMYEFLVDKRRELRVT